MPNSVEERLAVLEEIVKRLDKMLFGTEGRPSVIDEIRKLREADIQKLERLHQENVERMELIENTTAAHMIRIERKQDRILWIAIGVYIAWGFFTGSGTVTLHKLIETFTKP